MAKIKNKKRKNADHIHTKKEAMQKKKEMNPFEIHVNKEKMRVLGKKQKNDRGLPGVARAKAIEKRKHTLLQEYKVANKSNKFMDRRIGEKNRDMTDEDKVMARFAAVRVKKHNKKSIFNLADDEVLTHRGQTLSEIEKFDDPRSDDEDEFEEKGNLDNDFVEDAHFGGGLFKKTGNEGAKTHKELIDQLIAESKKRKAEKQKAKEATLELTEKLDEEWKDLMPLLNKSKKGDEDNEVKPKVDDYDKVMRELRFEARGTVSDRLKTEDEVAKEEKEKLEQLEKDRLERMQGFVEEKNNKPNHRSADDLDDNFVYDSDPDPEYMLSYNTEGESNVKVDGLLNGKSIEANDKNYAESKEEEDEERDDESGDEESGDEESENENDNLSDLKDSESDSDEELNQSPVKKQKINGAATIATGNNQNKEESKVVDENQSDIQECIKTDLLKRKEIMEKARNELPFTFSLPTSYENLQNTFKDQSSNHQCVIIERMIKCNHPSLSQGNKDGLGVLFAYLLQHLNDLGIDAIDAKSTTFCFEVFSALVPQIYDLAQLNQENAHKSLLEVIKEKHEEYRKTCRQYPGVEVLLFLKLVSILFPTSDFRHQVVTPSFTFIEQMLNNCKVNRTRDIAYGLFLCTLVLEYTMLSKRYMPAVINYLGGLLHMSIPKSGVKLIKVNRPFKSTFNQLVLLEKSTNDLKNFKMQCTDLLDQEIISEEFKIRCFYTTVRLLQEFATNLKDVSSVVEIFQNVQSYLLLIDDVNYPEAVCEEKQKLQKQLNEIQESRKLVYIVMEAKKPKALRLYEPKIVAVYDGKRHKVQSREKAERDKMLHKIKREKKGALREIRRDKAFLGRVKIHQKLQSDKERKEKVKKIFSEAAMQQSELKSLDRQNKRK